jgi:hypothetical protein
MQAVMRVNTFDPAKLADSSNQLEEFDRLHAAQPGYVGNVTVDLGGSRRFVLNLWDTEQHRQEGLRALGPAVERLVNPLLAKPSELVGVGPVLESDLTKAAASD